jgi:hypothetical protein
VTNPLISGASTPSDPQWFGLYNGIVVNANDPTNAGRVQLQIPQVLGNAISNWAQSQQTGTAPPAIGTQVWVQFLGGNVNSPYYSEGLSSEVIQSITSNTSNVLNSNPYFIGGDISEWSATGGILTAIMPNPDTNPPYINAALWTSTGTTGGAIDESPTPFPVVAGNDYSISAFVYYPLGGNVTIGATFNVTGSLAQQSNTFVVPAATWTPIEYASTAPAGATQGFPFVGPQNSSIGDLFYAEAVTVTGQIDGNLIVAGSIQQDSVNFTAQEIGANGVTINTDGTQPIAQNTGDLWFDGSNGFQLNQWNGSAWNPYQFGTNAIQAGSITANEISASAIVAGAIAAGAIDGFTINGATINGNTVSAADFLIQQGDGGMFYYTTGGANQIVKTYTSSGTWVAPTGVTTVQVQCWGAGGGGASGHSGCGGGSGEYAEETTINVTPGHTYTFTIHSGGAGGAADSGSTNNGSNGGGSTVFTGDSGGANSGVVTAHAGSGGTGSAGAGGTGSTATTHFNGGAGGQGGGAGGTTTYQKQYNALNTYSYSGSDSFGSPNTLGSYGQGNCIQGGYSPDTYNGDTYSYILFPTSTMVADFGNATAINFFVLTLKNLHSWNNSGMTWVLGWSSRTSFPSTTSNPSGHELSLSNFATAEGATTTSGNLPATIGTNFQNGSAHCIVLYPGNGDLGYYGYCTPGSGPGCPFITVNYTLGNTGGGGGGGSSDTGTGGAGAAGSATGGGKGGTTFGGAGGAGQFNGAGSAGAASTLVGGGGGGGVDAANGHGAAGGAGGPGQIILTYTPAGSGVLGGSIAGEAGTDPVTGTAFPEGAYFDQTTLSFASGVPSTPTLGPCMYGTSAGYGKYVGTDGSPYQFGKLLLYNGSNQGITLATQTGLNAANGINSQMTFPIVNGTRYKVEGEMFWTTSTTSYIRMNFGNVAWSGNINTATWVVNLDNTDTLTVTITSNGIVSLPQGTTTYGANPWWTMFKGFITANASGNLLVQGGCDPSAHSWTFAQNSWFSFEPVM